MSHIKESPTRPAVYRSRSSRALGRRRVALAVPRRWTSWWDGKQFATEEDWSRAVGRSSVRFQRDPDHHSSGAKLEVSSRMWLPRLGPVNRTPQPTKRAD